MLLWVGGVALLLGSGPHFLTSLLRKLFTRLEDCTAISLFDNRKYLKYVPVARKEWGAIPLTEPLEF